MIEYHFETTFSLQNQNELTNWIKTCISKEGFSLDEISYIFCDDAYLSKLNVEFLKHDTLTDIISFDNSLGKTIGGDIFISVERVAENAELFNTPFLNELHRVMIHGVLHYVGYNDKTKEDKAIMRGKENEMLSSLSN